ncbi:hypothetical protein GCM10023185_06150 [Hymenobacter saemangeumensis]|uniref:T9SS type A sorting domain-containing protein n=1 Tax=Hymenobacter saemangeumensis TaxID=1084522 RepID=A0ABP8I1F2_9BACT
MRSTFYPLLLLASTNVWAQVSPIIDRSDMPAVSTSVPVDSMRQSQAAAMLPAGAPQLTQRGANQTWNYSTLVATSQTVDRYISVAATNSPIYQFSFGVLGGVNRATVASPEALPAALAANSPITDPYQFYNASNADYRSVGYGGTVGGQQVPVTYRSQAEQDVIYRFPLSFASPRDSSRSFLETPQAAASTGYFSRKRKRVNQVDAWGTLITPFGTFQTVRIVSKITEHDSLATGGMPGTGFDVPLTREYKWLAKTHHVPVLTIITQMQGTTETITAVQYRDRYRRIMQPTAARGAAAEAAVLVYPNPLGTEALRVDGLSGRTVRLTATDVTGRVLFARELPVQQGAVQLPATVFGAFHGVALLRIQTEQVVAVRRIVRQ